MSFFFFLLFRGQLSLKHLNMYKKSIFRTLIGLFLFSLLAFNVSIVVDEEISINFTEIVNAQDTACPSWSVDYHESTTCYDSTAHCYRISDSNSYTHHYFSGDAMVVEPGEDPVD